MEELIYLEVLDRAGRVRERHRLTQFPVIIGRDYSCDILLDDEYVSPRHLRIEQDAGGLLVAADLESSNGSFVGASTLPVERVNLGAETLLRVGRSHLRLRKPAFPVPAALPLDGTAGRLGRWLRSGWVFMVLLALTAGIYLLDNYLGTFVKTEWARRSFALMPLAVMLALWAGPWALASRVFTHEANYTAHASMACLALLGFFALDAAYEYISFAFATETAADMLFLAVLALLLGLLLFGHLRFSTQQPTRRLFLAGTGIAALLAALGGFSQHVMNLEFSHQLDYSPTLKPLAFKRTASQSPEAFLQSLGEIRAAVDVEATE